jgi:NAD(P)-dependent dehydrogenase (short-subunit alcohol dehydrogenase family)
MAARGVPPVASGFQHDGSGATTVKIANLFSVEGKVAVVTGGSRGIGAMIAEGLVINGARVYITARNGAACDATAATLSTDGECISLPADLAKADQRDALVAAVGERERGIDILVNNAGAAWLARLGEFPEAGIDKVFDLNMKAPFLLTQSFLPMLRARASADDPSRVIMIGSVDGTRVPDGEQYSYSMSKAGIHMLTRHLAHYMVDDNITVNAIAPGPFESKMMDYKLGEPSSRARVAAAVPRRRIGTPEDMAGAVLYLTSRAGAYLTGAIIPVDGGVSTHG